jgi:hypothetical protein
MQKSHVGVQTKFSKKKRKEKKKEILEKGSNGCFLLDLRGKINLYVSCRVTWCTMSASRVVVRMSWEGLGTLCAAILNHVGNLESLLRPSWPNAEEIGNEMYHLVDILMRSGVDQKWFSGYAVVEGEEVMLMTPGICAVSFDFLYDSSRERYPQLCSYWS